MTKRIKLLGGEYTETSGEKYIVRRGSSVILSRAAYVELIGGEDKWIDGIHWAADGSFLGF